MTIADEKYIALTTYRKSGEGVVTPVWVNAVSDGRIGFWTSDGSGKTKRMANNARVTVQASDARGRAKPGSSPITGTAEMIHDGPLFDEVTAKGKKKYGVMVTISKLMGQLMGQRKSGQVYADTVVLIRLDEQ
ncbi:MAG: hypothetical protein NVSMB48_25250 [Marmoricola sp.]